MLFTAPIKSRNGEMAFCSHCKSKQEETIGMTMAEYLKCKNRLDDGLSEIEEEYFNEKYMVCSNCGNICEMFSDDNMHYFDAPEIQEIINSNKPQTEKNFLIMHVIKNNYESLLDLYHYYQFMDMEKETKHWREILLTYCENVFHETDLLYYLRMMIELNRRNGDFDKALNLIKTEYKRVKDLDKNNDFSKYATAMFEHDKIKEEKRLCKAKNRDIAIWEVPRKYKI